MSSNGTEHDNCGTTERRCRTVDQAIRLTISNNDTESKIIIDGGDLKRNVYEVREHSIITNKSIIIKSDSRSNFIPLVRRHDDDTSSKAVFNIILGEHGSIKVESVDWENIVLANISHTKFIFVELNNCHVYMSIGNSFIHFNRINNNLLFHSKNCKFFGNADMEAFFVLEFSLSSDDSDELIHFFDCSFHHTLISTKTKATFLIENCYFNNALVFIQGATLIISYSVFENSEGRINHTILPQDKALFVLNSTFSEIKNCQFVNNKISVIRLFNSSVSFEKTSFVNNTGTETNYYGMFHAEHFNVMFYAKHSNVTILNSRINHNRNYRIIIMSEECEMKMNHTSVTNSKCKGTLIKVFYITIVHFQVINTIISNNTAFNIIENDCYDFPDMFPMYPADFTFLKPRIDCKGGIDLFYVSKCLFQGNVLKNALLELKRPANIFRSVFESNEAKYFVLAERKVFANTVSFISNKCEYDAILVTNVLLESSSFERNTIGGSLISFTSRDWDNNGSEIRYINVTQNIITNNIIHLSRGILGQRKIEIQKLAIHFNSFLSCFRFSSGSVFVKDAVITRNNATGIGKLLHFSEDTYDRYREGKPLIDLKNINSSFNTLPDVETTFFYILWYKGFVKMHKINLYLTEGKNESLIPVATFVSKRYAADIEMDLKIQCSPNYNPYSTEEYTDQMFNYRLFCKSCPRGLYTTQGGSASLFSIKIPETKGANSKVVRMNQTSSDCNTCPAGATCLYKLTSRGNFYGFLNVNNFVEFIPCPEKYCCSTEEAPCTSYNTCNSNRIGILCGRCAEGYYLSYFSNKCIPLTKCTGYTRSLFWILYFTSAVTLTLILCFTEDVYNVLRMFFSLLKKKIIRYYYKNENECENENLRLLQTDKTAPPSYDIMPRNDKQTETNFPCQISFSAIFNILVSFYQLQNLLQVPVDDKNQWSLISLISDFFNLNVMIERLDKYCPLKEKDAVYRNALKNMFFPISMVLTVVLFMYIRKFCIFFKYNVLQTSPQTNRSRKKRVSLTQRFYVGYYIVMAFSYEKLSSIAFSLINCIKINGLSVLYIAGDVKCFTSWQIFNIIFLALWVIPFPLVVTIGYYLLKKKEISVWIFLVCITFPPLLVIFCFIIKCCHFPVRTKSKGRNEQAIINNLQEIFEEPYKWNYFWWESWTLYERLIVACITTYVIDPVVRLCALAPVILFFLWFHYWSKPFKHTMKILLQVDIGSYICLCLSLVVNMVRGIVYIYSLPSSQYPIALVLKASFYLEYLFTPIWPLIIYLVVTQAIKKIKHD